MKKIVTIVFLIFISLTQLATADQEKDFVDEIFRELDINKDGIIDKNDIQKFSKKEFDLMDTNKDGIISKKEFFTFVCDKNCNTGNCECKNYKNKADLDYMVEYWERIDRNSDGNIIFQEKLEADLDNFYSLDFDGNGKITRTEVEAQLY